MGIPFDIIRYIIGFILEDVEPVTLDFASRFQMVVEGDKLIQLSTNGPGDNYIRGNKTTIEGNSQFWEVELTAHCSNSWLRIGMKTYKVYIL